MSGAHATHIPLRRPHQWQYVVFYMRLLRQWAPAVSMHASCSVAAALLMGRGVYLSSWMGAEIGMAVFVHWLCGSAQEFQSFYSRPNASTALGALPVHYVLCAPVSPMGVSGVRAHVT